MSNNKAVRVFQYILALAILVIAGVGAFYALKAIGLYVTKGLEWLITIAEKDDAVIIVALVSAVVTIVTMVVAKVTEYRQATKRYLYSKREEPYTDFIEVVYKLRDVSKKTDAYPESEMIQDLVKISKGLTLWGSNKVIKKWIKFRTNSVNNKLSPTENLLVLEDIIFDIRRDMGHRRGLLQKGDMLKFFINDVDETLLSSSTRKPK